MTALEQRYRRLLRCYPPSHRAAHREEMLGVLLATARPGQRMPGAGQALNLAACGLAIRARRALTAGPWQDALAVLSLVAPVLMVVTAAVNVAGSAREALDEAAFAQVPAWQLLSFVATLAGPVVMLAGWLTVVILALTGRPRAAATLASVPVALTLVNLLALSMERTGAWSGALPGFLYSASVGPAVIASLAACSLAFSAGPRRGLDLVGGRRAGLMIAGLSVAFTFTSVVSLLSPNPDVFSTRVMNLLDISLVAIAIAVTCTRSPAGGRVAALLAVGQLTGLSASSSPSSPAT